VALSGLAMKVGPHGLFCDFGPAGSRATDCWNGYYQGCIYRGVV
jgi:hypothetical protein